MSFIKKGTTKLLSVRGSVLKATRKGRLDCERSGKDNLCANFVRGASLSMMVRKWSLKTDSLGFHLGLPINQLVISQLTEQILSSLASPEMHSCITMVSHVIWLMRHSL